MGGEIGIFLSQKSDGKLQKTGQKAKIRQIQKNGSIFLLLV
jgi:hypothetical protein